MTSYFSKMPLKMTLKHNIDVINGILAP